MSVSPAIPGRPPAILLHNPKFAHNVGGVLRACSCYGIRQLWWTGNRVTLDTAKGQRLPREERMKGYRDVEMVHSDRAFDAFGRDATPVAVELRPGAEMLPDFAHPERALYVFGPEDGSLPSPVVRHCHRFLVIPTRHCLNLSAAVYTVLYDRMVKRYQAGLEPMPELVEARGPEENIAVFAGISDAGLGKKR